VIEQVKYVVTISEEERLKIAEAIAIYTRVMANALPVLVVDGPPTIEAQVCVGDRGQMQLGAKPKEGAA